MIETKTKFDPITNMLQVVLSHGCDENLNEFEMFISLEEIEELIEKLETEIPNFKERMYEVDNFDIECRHTKSEIIEMIESGGIYPSDGDGYWGTEDHYSYVSVFEEPPSWATHGYWYNK